MILFPLLLMYRSPLRPHLRPPRPLPPNPCPPPTPSCPLALLSRLPLLVLCRRRPLASTHVSSTRRRRRPRFVPGVCRDRRLVLTRDVRVMRPESHLRGRGRAFRSEVPPIAGDSSGAPRSLQGSPCRRECRQLLGLAPSCRARP
ncbi:hypothetical protein BV20DRAFT_1005664 [Pilatotrama ljubarskyi]|nr:hypothetical protein BV20DRAFT_1005664 [Pilatotrama ljubarskyi]